MCGDASLALKPDTVSYNDVISAFEKGAELRGHLRSKSHSMRCICSRNSSPGLRPDVITYNAAISACEKGQKVQHALHMYKIGSPEASCAP